MIGDTPDGLDVTAQRYHRTTDAPGISHELDRDRFAFNGVEAHLRDLVMLEALDEIDGFIDDVTNGRDPSDRIERTREQATIPDLFDEIIRKSVDAQFDDTYTFVRELAQNGKDAYRHETDRSVTFETANAEDTAALRVHDQGRGMGIGDVVSDLLVPYNSGKKTDPDLIGEHGIGFYSVLHPADQIDILTGDATGHVAAQVTSGDTGWEVSLQSGETPHQGTQIAVYDDSGSLDPDQVYKSLRHHVGLTDPETTDVTLNGEKINNRARQYRHGATYTEDGTDSLDVYFREGVPINDYLLTQDGLFVERDQIFNVFDGDDPEQRLQNEILRELQSNGYEFWVDLPDSIGLTKGRNEVVAADAEKAYEMTQNAFEEFMITTMLEDDAIVKEIDLSIAEWIENVMEGEYADRTMRHRIMEKVPTASDTVNKLYTTAAFVGALAANASVERSETAGRDGAHSSRVKRLGASAYGLGRDLVTGELSISTEVDSDDIDNRDRPDLSRSDFSAFSERLFDEPFIPGYELEDGVATDTSISIDTVITAAAEDRLYSTRKNVPKDADDGLYIDRTHPVGNAVINRMEQTAREVDRSYHISTPNLRSAAVMTGAGMLGSLGWAGEKAQQSIQSFLAQRDDIPSPHEQKRKLARTPKWVIDDIYASEDLAAEYHVFLEAAQYLDGVLTEATDLPPAYIHGYWDPDEPEVQAHTDGYSFMAMHFRNSANQRMIEEIRDGYISQDTFDDFTELMVHEKTHIKDGSQHIHSGHGSHFQELKRDMRDAYQMHTVANGIDPYTDINNYLEDHDLAAQPATDKDALLTAVDEHSRFF